MIHKHTQHISKLLKCISNYLQEKMYLNDHEKTSLKLTCHQINELQKVVNFHIITQINPNWTTAICASYITNKLNIITSLKKITQSQLFSPAKQSQRKQKMSSSSLLLSEVNFPSKIHKQANRLIEIEDLLDQNMELLEKETEPKFENDFQLAIQNTEDKLELNCAKIEEELNFLNFQQDSNESYKELVELQKNQTLDWILTIVKQIKILRKLVNKLQKVIEDLILIDLCEISEENEEAMTKILTKQQIKVQVDQEIKLFESPLSGCSTQRFSFTAGDSAKKIDFDIKYESTLPIQPPPIIKKDEKACVCKIF